jgi:pyruvate/2-oxoglutarate dehydrogenase complex dihydrolipoamide acyltransferase (E2) component
VSLDVGWLQLGFPHAAMMDETDIGARPDGTELTVRRLLHERLNLDIAVETAMSVLVPVICDVANRKAIAFRSGLETVSK